MGAIRLVVALMLAGAALLAPRSASACQCGGPDYQRALTESKFVFRGKVASSSNGEAQFDVTGYYKGSGPEEVHARGAGIGMCTRRFTPGGIYVVFAKPSLVDSYCSATFQIRGEGERWGKLPEASPTGSVVERRAATRPRSGRPRPAAPRRPGAEWRSVPRLDPRSGAERRDALRRAAGAARLGAALREAGRGLAGSA